MLDLIYDKKGELLKFFCKNPTEQLNISEISESIDISKPYISERITHFSKEDILNIKTQGNQKIASFNRDNSQALKLKQLINLDALYSSGVIEDLVELYSYPETIVLFGSFAKGEDTEESDIDIAVITSESHKYEKTVMKRPVSVTEFDKEIPSNMLETLANGITIYGHLEVKRQTSSER